MSEEGTSDFPPADDDGQGQPAPQPNPAQGSAGSAEGKRKRGKIDLKSRLSNVRATGSMAAVPTAQDRKSDPLAFPPPPPAGSVPAPRIAGGLPGIASPFAPPEPEVKVTAQAQTIKVEVAEEVVAERKKASKRSWYVALLTLIMGAGVGFLLGNTFEKGRAGRDAAANAGALLSDVEAAQKSAGDMSDTIRKSRDQLMGGEFPADLPKYLRDTSVDFGSDKWSERRPGGLPKEVLGSLLRYASDVEKLQNQKRKVAGLLERAQQAATEHLTEKKTKKVRYAVKFAKQEKEGKKSFVAHLGVLTEPFPPDKAWPETLKLKIGKDEVEAVMFGEKSPVVNEEGGKPAAIILDPDTVDEFSRGDALIGQLGSSIQELYQLIEGVESNDPNEATPGLFKNGTALITGLKKVVEATR